MWQFLISLITSPLIKAGLEAYKAKLQLENSDDQRALKLLEAEINADIAARSEATKILIAEQGHWFTRSVRPTMGWIIIILMAKILLYDKAFGDWTGGHTDGLDPYLWNVVNVVIASYFGSVAVERVARIFKR